MRSTTYSPSSYVPFLGRNDLCWCGSGKKYKKCHLLSDKIHPTPLPSTQRIILKTPQQIAAIRQACKLVRNTLDMLQSLVQEGVTTNQINQWVHEYTLAYGAKPAPLNYRGYPKSVCTSINEVVCHGIPDDRSLKPGDILNVDVTSVLNGYYGDSSRMFLIEPVSDEARRLCKTTEQCLQFAIQQVKPGIHLGDIGHVIQSHAEKQGYSVVRDFVGHGTGIAFHEAPMVPHFGKPKTGIKLLPNMIFTIEPMINAGNWQVEILSDQWTAITRDHSLSAQYEHTVLVTGDSHEVLT